MIDGTINRGFHDALSDYHFQIGHGAEAPPLLLEYILYRAGKNSDFVKRFTTLLDEPDSSLERLNGYSCCAVFNESDTAQIVDVFRRFLERELAEDNVRRFEVVDTLLALQNRSLLPQVLETADDAFLAGLEKAVTTSDLPGSIRVHALSLLRKLDPERTLMAIAQVLAANTAETEMKKEIHHQIETGLTRSISSADPKFVAPPENLEAQGAWAEWLATARAR